ncbi:MAG: DUF1566 domain-containing protein, partial [Deltaproteobacteria bacterium]|nr:DUF1566 domain-containing protein [Deltaproteobacteria bacterium]
TNTNSFSLDWTNPSDVSGIAGAYYKLGSAPTSNTDGTYTTDKPFTISATAEGGEEIYVWLKDGAGNTDYNNRSSTNLYYDATTPPAPTSLTATPGTWTNVNSFSIDWTNPTDDSGIAGAYYKLGSAPTSNTDGTYTTDKPFTVSATAEGGEDIYVWLKDGAGNTDYNNTSSTTLSYDATAPTGTLTATPGDGQVALSWSDFTDATSGISGYTLVYSTTDYPATCSHGTELYTGTETSYTHTSLTNETTYYYRVCATDHAGNTSTGATADATPGSVPEATSYTIYVNLTTGVAKDNYLEQRTTTSICYIWTGLNNGYTYYFVVTAVNEHGESEDSNEVSGMPKGLVAYYPFNGDANDESGNMNDGTVYGATLAEDRFGNSSSAYSFDGVDDQIKIPNDSSICFGSGPFTISFWIETCSKEISLIIDKNYSYVASGYYRFKYFPDYVMFMISDAAHPSSNTNIVSDTAIKDGGWHHIVGVRDTDDGVMRIYVDGREDATPVEDTIIDSTDNSKPLSFGGPSVSGESFYNGLIDDVRIYNRALSEPEVQSLYSYPDTIVDTISVNDSPFGAAANTSGSYVYITHNPGNTISVIQTSDNTVIDSITVGDRPTGVAVTTDEAYVYVTNYNSNTISVIQTSDNTVLGSIPVGDSPHGIAISPDGNYVYAANVYSGTVSVIQTSDNTVIDTITVGTQPHGVATSPNGDYVYAANANDGTVSVIQTSDNTVVDTISVGDRTLSLAVTPNDKYVYVFQANDGTVSVIQTSDYTVIDTITVGTQPHGVATSPNGDYVYVANREDDTISVIRSSDNTVVDAISVGDHPYCVAPTSDGAFLYVPNGVGNTVSVIGFSTSCSRSIPDTGQTQSYTETFGEDSDYTINPPSYTDNCDGTVTDNVTGLMWQQEDDDITRTWDEACAYCSGLTLACYSDWRLPSVMELMSIVNYGTYDPSIETTYFPNTNAAFYWTSTTYALNSADAWCVGFNDGNADNVAHIDHDYVRCVRSGQ